MLSADTMISPVAVQSVKPNSLPTTLMTSAPDPSWQQLKEAISLKREELRQLEEQQAFMRENAAATARNILRAYDVSVDEMIASLADDSKAELFANDNSRKPRRVAAPKPTPIEHDAAAHDPGPLSRLPTTVKTVLANQGLRTFEAIARAVDSGEIRRLARMGPTRQAQLDDWLKQERQRPRPFDSAGLEHEQSRLVVLDSLRASPSSPVS